MYASSTAGLFYFMNRNISRDNWTRGARPPLNCLHTWPCAYRVCHTPYPVYIRRTHHYPRHHHRVASRRVTMRLRADCRVNRQACARTRARVCERRRRRLCRKKGENTLVGHDTDEGGNESLSSLDALFIMWPGL